MFEIFMPKLTHEMKSGVLIRWLKREGDLVKKGDLLFEVETDKAVSEVEAEVEGYLSRVAYHDGDEVLVGSVLAYLAGENEDIQDIEQRKETILDRNKEKSGDLVRAQTDILKEKNESSDEKRIFITPIARHLAQEHEIDITRLTGSGPDGTIIERDVLGSLTGREKNRQTEPPETAERAYKDIPLGRIMEQMANRMLESIQNAPQFTVEVDVNWLAIESLRDIRSAQSGQKISHTAIIVKAAAIALEKYPLLNATFMNNTARQYEEINIGVAFHTEQGLLVPVVKQADVKNLLEIVQVLDAFKDKSKRSDFLAKDLDGGTFTISNLGMFGIDRFSAIINPPQSGILAVGKINERAVKTSEGIIFNPFATLRLTADHRLIDGVYASQFLVELKQLLENPEGVIFRQEE